jgi:hypothetical protein
MIELPLLIHVPQARVRLGWRASEMLYLMMEGLRQTLLVLLSVLSLVMVRDLFLVASATHQALVLVASIACVGVLEVFLAQEICQIGLLLVK